MARRTACTDVTGFGLAWASGGDDEAVPRRRPNSCFRLPPLLDGVLDTVRLGILSLLHAAECATAACRCGDVDDSRAG